MASTSRMSNGRYWKRPDNSDHPATPGWTRCLGPGVDDHWFKSKDVKNERFCEPCRKSLAAKAANGTL